MQQDSNLLQTQTNEELKNAVVSLQQQVILLATAIEEQKKAMAGLVRYLQAKEQADEEVRQEG